MTDNAPGAELQTLVEALSLAIDRPVLLDDAALVPIAFSRQWGEIDEVRESSILGRGPDRRVRDALLGQGIARAVEPVRTDPVSELGMAGRVCVPVRTGETTVGFLWLVDPNETVTGEDIARVEQAAASAAELLATQPDPSLAEETALVTALCSPVEADRDRAVEEVVTGGRLGDRPLVAVRVAAVGPAIRLGDFARRIVHRVAAGHALAGRTSSGLLILLDLDEPALRVLEPTRLSQWVHQAADRLIAVGQSGMLSGPREVVDGRRQAELALRVARARPQGAEFASWETLGADRLVCQLPANARGDVPDQLQRLITTEPDLTATLAAFLDAAGDVKRTAAKLSLHRSGLYYRLQRIEELTGLDLGQGDDRLLAHLALRLAGQSS